ncbi:MAG TPA: Hsp20/alpha crystallin family protein [Gemmatimonadales bacterium]|nr:Hsp20/alpha crystallin family protein [Gemmatimonadales bacterium]
MDEAFNAWPFRVENGATPLQGMLPAVDVTEDEQGVQIVAEIPGYKPESVKVAIENRVLTMSGEKANGSFKRSFTVPAAIDTDRIEASVEHGVLTVTLPKAEQAKPREIPVQAK